VQIKAKKSERAKHEARGGDCRFIMQYIATGCAAGHMGKRRGGTCNNGGLSYDLGVARIAIALDGATRSQPTRWGKARIWRAKKKEATGAVTTNNNVRKSGGLEKNSRPGGRASSR